MRTDPSLPRPDIQLHFVLGLVDDHGRKRHFKTGYSLHVCVLRPKSRGSVGFADADPMSAPRIDPAFLSEPADLELLVKGVRLGQRIMTAPAFRALDPRSSMRPMRATMQSSSGRSASAPTPSIIPSAPAAWAPPTIRRPSSTRR